MSRSPARRLTMVAVVGGAALLVPVAPGVWAVGVGPDGVAPASSTTSTVTTAGATGTSARSAGTARPARATLTALRAAGALRVRGRAPMTGYTRARFGAAWYDADHNGCDTRNDILRRDLRSVSLKPGTHGCVVASGLLHDPYTGTTIHFVRGRASSKVQIDHVVALGDAWATGAQSWPSARRRQFANDPRNLLAVDGPTNMRKGDGDTATWLPPRRAFRCAYVARQVSVKRAYGLWVTRAERAAMIRVLSTCPVMGLVTHSAIPGAAGPSGP